MEPPAHLWVCLCVNGPLTRARARAYVCVCVKCVYVCVCGGGVKASDSSAGAGDVTWCACAGARTVWEVPGSVKVHGRARHSDLVHLLNAAAGRKREPVHRGVVRHDVPRAVLQKGRKMAGAGYVDAALVGLSLARARSRARVECHGACHAHRPVASRPYHHPNRLPRARERAALTSEYTSQCTTSLYTLLLTTPHSYETMPTVSFGR